MGGLPTFTPREQQMIPLLVQGKSNKEEQTLFYEENCKGSLCFFRWDTRRQDWRGTDWALMPPFLQVGLLLDGQLATYINTLDLY